MITWEEEPSLALNHLLSEDITPFPRGYPFTKRNIVRFLNAIIDGSVSSKKFKLPDTRNSDSSKTDSPKKKKRTK